MPLALLGRVCYATGVRLGLWAAILMFAVTGCSAGICSRPESSEPKEFTGGEIVGDMYRTSDFDGDLLHFPGGAFYKIHHGLGERPVDVAFFLSFERDGLGSGSLSQAAGNQVELKAMDEETITVLNGSCADYYLVVHAHRGEGAGTAGSGGAGGS